MKRAKVVPWSATEIRHLDELLRAYPEYADRTICNQFRYYCPHHEHSEKAVRSKINTLRPNKCKSKWNAIAHTRLAQMVTNKNTYEDMAKEFNTSVNAIIHQVSRIKNLGLINKTPGRKVNLHSRTIRPVMVKDTGEVDYELDPNDYTKKKDGTASDINNSSYKGSAMIEYPVTKQLNLDFNQKDAVAKQNKLSSQIRAIDNSVAKLMQQDCDKLIGPETARTATEISMGYSNQQRMLDNLLQVANNLTQVLNNTLQIMVFI